MKLLFFNYSSLNDSLDAMRKRNRRQRHQLVDDIEL